MICGVYSSKYSATIYTVCLFALIFNDFNFSRTESSIRAFDLKASSLLIPYAYKSGFYQAK